MAKLSILSQNLYTNDNWSKNHQSSSKTWMEVYEQTISTRNYKIAHLLTNSSKTDQLPFELFFSHILELLHLHYNVIHLQVEPKTAKLAEFPAFLCLILFTKALLTAVSQFHSAL